ncbi:MAG: hypothetical protein K9M07_01055 [Simkaniaceae bacterium]|nr:hypothetical protein [Simkaniaceae bacterium]
MSVLSAISIDEKMGQLGSNEIEEGFDIEAEVKQLNPKLSQLRQQLKAQYQQIDLLIQNHAHDHEFQALLSQINQVKEQLYQSESDWRQKALQNTREDGEGYGLWDQEETTVSQLILEYGSSDYLYVIPPDLAASKLNLHSGIPIPRESWSDLIEIILAHNGIGIEQVNPYTRKLFSLKKDLVSASIITNDYEHLLSLADLTRVIYIFSPLPEHFKNAYHFLERFRDPSRTFVYTVGNKISLVSTKEEVLKLVQLYQSVWEKGDEKITRIVGCSKIKTEEMQKILKAFFGSVMESDRYSMAKGINDISILPLANEHSLAIVGSRDLVLKAEQIIQDTETQFEIPCEMTLEWYNCKHSDPNDLAEVLQKVYSSLICYSLNDKKNEKIDAQQNVNIDISDPEYPPPPYIEDNIINAPNPVNPPAALSTEETKKSKVAHTRNFIPYPKTGALMMVVRRDTFGQIKELLKKLDVPKKMVHVEVLLCEKKVTYNTNTGLNLLKLGSAASNIRQTGIDFDASASAIPKGLFSFFISRPKTRSSIPAFDITYNFLMSQDDIRINSSPSTTMINQTPATISLVEELSVNSGAAPINNNQNITFEKAYIRKQYGITIYMTPTIHEPDPGDENQQTHVTLKTNITFDTQKSDINDQPKVDRRHLENQVRVVDGQTIVIGGLRRKTSDDSNEKVPFLGEIPGIAKLFGFSRMTDELTEMFIFITPKVINDPYTDMEKIKEEEIKRRAGDCPEYLCRLLEAQKAQKQKLFAQSFKLIFGNMND